MQTVNYAFAGVALAAIVFGVNAYIHLWRWAKMCQKATIAVAYNNRVKFNATLVEWLTWCNQLKHDENAKGRVVYRANKVTVSILRPEANIQAKTTVKRIRNFRKSRKGKVTA